MYTVARSILKITKWLWPVVLIPLIAAAISTLVPLFVQAQPGSPLYMFLTPGPVRNNTLTISIVILGILILAPLVTWLILLTEGRTIGNKVLRKYLRAVEEAYQGLNLKDFAQQSDSISVNLPLNAIFIHLKAVSDRPRYDLPSEQLLMLEELRSGSHSDMTPEQREEQIQRLRVLWYSQTGQDWAEGRQKQNATIEEILKALKPERPVAVILGTPGSGKSTTMSWLALKMARASLSRRSDLPEGLAPRQIPILIRISDYAKSLSAETMPFRQFFTEHITRAYPELTTLSTTLLDELKKGRCLLLFDGLDEVASDSLRRRVAEQIYAFISDYNAESTTTQHFNRFIVTSRIVGYEVGTFNRYAHYTLRDLEDKQIQQFLASWCPVVERYRTMASQGMQPLTAQQEVQAIMAGDAQRARLLEALENNPGIKRLAANPWMLTILALIQRTRISLPYRRIELYQVITRTLLDNWKNEKGMRVFSVEEIPLAEQLLGDLAYRLQSSDPVLTEQDVKKIAYHALDTFYQHQPDEAKEAAVQEFIEILRSSNGLFVESGQGLFSFIHRTFQEYYAALNLIHKSPEELQQFVIENHTNAIWHEPLLLAIAYKSIQRSQKDHRLASELIEVIANATDDYERILRRSLLFAANCIVDCSVWSIIPSLQIEIAYQIFGLYGDSYGIGRYNQLQQDIEEVALLWLRGQQQGGTQQDTMPPLLTAWRIALINNDKPDPLRQEGAVHLLASIAPDLASCPKLVLQVLVPPLLQLAGVQDWYRRDLSCPSEIHTQLFQTTVRPYPLRVGEYALVALRLLEAAGPAGWLHADWCRWGEEQPELLERLSRHSAEGWSQIRPSFGIFGYLLTPASLPASEYDPNWAKQIQIAEKWVESGGNQTMPQRMFRQRALQYIAPIAIKPGRHDKQVLWQSFQHTAVTNVEAGFKHNPLVVQVQLLQASDTARYPHAYLFKQMLEKELASPSTLWGKVWDTSLQKEMSYGRYATYQACLHLRLLLCQDNDPQRQEIANELVRELSKQGKQHTQALIVISNLYMLDKRDLQNFPFIPYLRDLRDIYKRYLVNSPYASELRDLRDLHELSYLQFMIDLRDIRDLQFIGYGQDLQHLKKLRDLLNKDQIIGILSNLLKQQAGASSSTALFALYSTLSAYDSIPPAIAQQVDNSIQAYQRQRQLPSVEERQLTQVILRQIGISPIISHSLTRPAAIQSLPDERATQLDTLKQQDQLSKSDVEEILAACIDTRELSEKKWKESQTGYSAGIVGSLLSQSFSIEAKAIPTVVQALNDSNAVVCAAAALLLQNCKKVPQDMREDSAKRIINILLDDELSRRPLDPPWEEYGKIWRLDDVLFETLKMLEE